MSRAYTKEEVRQQFLAHVRMLIKYWNSTELERDRQRRLEGLAFSILVLLDGGTELPSFQVIPCPHEHDRGFNQMQGKNWYPDDVDIGGVLHEELYCSGMDGGKQ